MSGARMIRPQWAVFTNVLLLVAALLFSSSRPVSTGPSIRASGNQESTSRVLVFSRTAGFRHDAIPDAVAAIGALGSQHGFAVDATEDATVFNDAQLAEYRAVVFLLTTGDVLDPDQQAAFERYIRAGNGYVGVHSATDTEYDWPWYGELVGAYFQSHPEIQTATIVVEDRDHPSTAGLPEQWVRTDEWYNFRANPRGNAQILARLDETSYAGGAMGAEHPIAWYHEYDGGRAWYTAMGHTRESYAEPLFLQHLLGGIQYAAGIEAVGTGSTVPNEDRGGPCGPHAHSVAVDAATHRICLPLDNVRGKPVLRVIAPAEKR